MLVVAVGLTSCGRKTQTEANAENNGVYVHGGAITYQLQISRELNQYGTEDAQYLAGLPAGTARLCVRHHAHPCDQEWYGVFLWGKNETSQPHVTSDSFDIVDTQGNRYYPVALNPARNPYAWTAQTLRPGGTEPRPDTTASFGPTQGGLLLFKLNTSVYDNRPLTLEIRGPSQQVLATISLDL